MKIEKYRMFELRTQGASDFTLIFPWRRVNRSQGFQITEGNGCQVHAKERGYMAISCRDLQGEFLRLTQAITTDLLKGKVITSATPTVQAFSR